VAIPGYVNVDLKDADVIVDLETELLPFPDESVDVLVCISAIKYFSRDRAATIIRDVHRVLKPGGIVRFGTQDLRLLAAKYLECDAAFYFEKLPDGNDRFPGHTFAEKFNALFHGSDIGPKHCKYVYDFETLKLLFGQAGFDRIEERAFSDSRIADVLAVDRRPEQMFFLEAVKTGGSARPDQDREGARAAWNQANALWREGRRDAAWQYILLALDMAPGEPAQVEQAAGIMLALDRSDDAVKVWKDCLAFAPEDAAARRGLAAAQAHAEDKAARHRESALPLGQVEEIYGSRLLQVQPDLYHLCAAMKWIARSHAATGEGASASPYYLAERRWGDSCPESTGYIIPTLLAFHRLTGEPAWYHFARVMGDWECNIQAPGGGAGEPFGVYIKRPRVFNTGQVMLGWIALYRATGDARYLDAAERAGTWVASLLDGEGRWTSFTHAGPKVHKVRVAWALLELYGVTGKALYREAAERSVRWMLTQAYPNGWSACIGYANRPWTHLIGYHLGGFLEVFRLNNADIDYERINSLLMAAAENIVVPYLRDFRTGVIKPYLGLPGTFDPNWRSTDSWSCVTGNIQIEFFLRRMARFANEPSLIQAADVLLEDTKRLQFITEVEDDNAYGGLPGSHPLNGEYFPHAIPNRGVKFFADSLLQRLIPAGAQDCLG
jgi:predicted SAM-dependent methyltransferase